MNTAILSKTNHSAIISIMFNFRRITMSAFGIGGFKLDFSTIAQLALAGMTGGTSLIATQMIQKIGMQLAMQLIQKIGEQMGVPQSMIDLAQAAFASSAGQPGLAKENIGQAVRGLVGELDLRPSDAGRLERQLDELPNKSMENMKQTVDDFIANLNLTKKPKSANGDDEESGSFLVALAKAMGKIMDKKAGQIQEKSDSIAAIADSKVKTDSEEGKKQQQKLSSETTLLQAYSQELSFISNAATTAIKSIGEAQVTLGRK
jgi:hypothetical protein